MQRCLLYTCDASVQRKEMESSLAAVKTFAKLRVSSGLRRTPHSSSDDSPAGLATPTVLHGVREEALAEAKPPAGASLPDYAVYGSHRISTHIAGALWSVWDPEEGQTPHLGTRDIIQLDASRCVQSLWTLMPDHIP